MNVLQFNSVTTGYTSNSKYAKLMTIPISKFQKSVGNNTFNCMFRIVWENASTSEYYFRDYSLTFLTTTTILLRCVTPDNFGYDVCGSIIDDECNIYATSNIAGAFIRLQILNCDNHYEIEFIQKSLFDEDFSVNTKIECVFDVLLRNYTNKRISSMSVLNANFLSGINTYLKIAKVEGSGFGGTFSLLVTTSDNEGTEIIQDIVTIKLRQNINTCQMSRISGKSKNGFQPTYYCTYDSGNTVYYFYISHTILVPHVITLLNYELTTTLDLRLIDDESAVSSMTGTTVETLAEEIEKGDTASRPTYSSTDYGRIYLDTDLDADGKPIWWQGTKWIDATGADA